MKYNFYQVDVFTDLALEGNPLAVFIDGSGLNPATMLKIAREMNLSETTFLLPSSDPEADFDLKIFTPGAEIPFAGHPTIGTAHVLFETGKMNSSKDAVTFKMGVGNIRVTRHEKSFFMKQPEAKFEAPCPVLDRLAETLSLDSSAICTEWPIQVVSTGFPALLIPLKSLELIRRIQLKTHLLQGILQDTGMLYAFTLETEAPESTVHARAFAPSLGIPEDPATGSVAGALGAYLAKHQIIEEKKFGRIQIEQGYEMGRPSLIQVVVGQKDGVISKIEVGGKSRILIEGILTL